MVSIIPAERTPWDVIGGQIGQGLSQTLPGAVEGHMQRRRANDALTQAQQDISAANGDPQKIALAIARVGANAPGLERALGPWMQTSMANATVNRAFPNSPQGTQQPNQMPGKMANNPTGQAKPKQMSIAPGAAQIGAQDQESPALQPQAQPSTYATPGPFNIMTVPDIEAESERYAKALQDPNAYQTRMAQLQAQNEMANQQRGVLEDLALKAHVSPENLAKFMNVGSKFNTRNPTEWIEKTKREFGKVQSADQALQKAFIPGIGNAIMGTNREQALKNIQPEVKRKVEAGLEQDTRDFLTDNYLTPTEIEETIRPLTPPKLKAIQGLPEGDFPPDIAGNEWERFMEVTGGREKRRPEMSFEEMKERNPEKLQQQQEELTDFFLNNIDDDTALLPIRHKLWKDKNYDWRQIGPAIHEAEKRGLTLSTRQQSEMADIDSQAPIESLPEIFQSFDRFWKYIQGSK